MTGKNWVRPVVLAVSCLILGFVAGWSLANVGGDDISLPDANVDVTVEPSKPATTVVDEQPTAPPARDAVTVLVLNGTPTGGLAARTATRLKGLGYAKVTTGNTASQTGPTVAYYRDGAKPAADQLAADMQIETVTPIAGTPLATRAAPSAQVVLVLGPG